MKVKIPKKPSDLKGMRTYICSALLMAHGGAGLMSDGPSWDDPYQQDPVSELLIGGGMASMRSALPKKKEDGNEGS